MLGYQGQRERWTPLTKIMRLSCPRLGQSNRSEVQWTSLSLEKLPL